MISHRTSKRIISFLIALMLLVAIAPVTVLADTANLARVDEVEYSTQGSGLNQFEYNGLN